jgi:hypothetical protein
VDWIEVKVLQVVEPELVVRGADIWKVAQVEGAGRRLDSPSIDTSSLKACQASSVGAWLDVPRLGISTKGNE